MARLPISACRVPAERAGYALTKSDEDTLTPGGAMPGTDLPTSAEVTTALDAADFPAGKDELIRVAQEAGAEDRVLRALRSLPPAFEYANRHEVLRSIDTMEASGTTPSEHAAQARAGGKPGLSQQERPAGRG
jgi:hypothetical protein